MSNQFKLPNALHGSDPDFDETAYIQDLYVEGIHFLQNYMAHSNFAKASILE